LKSIYVANSDSSRDCIRKALEVLDIGEEARADPDTFQLWAKTKLDEAPYPLIGKNEKVICVLFQVLCSVADPDTPDPQAVFGPPGSGSGSSSQRYGSGSGSFYH
jgi:hypothetical protein